MKLHACITQCSCGSANRKDRLRTDQSEEIQKSDIAKDSDASEEWVVIVK